MDRQFVCIQCDLYCSWGETPPVYRLYIGDELFAERTFIWRDRFLRETLNLSIVSGKYAIRFELVGEDADFKIRNMKVIEGPAFIKSNKLLKVRTA